MHGAAANQLRDNLRQLSPKIYPDESKLRLEYFYNHWDGFYRAAWCYGIALLLLAIAQHEPVWINRGRQPATKVGRQILHALAREQSEPLDEGEEPD